MDGNVQNDAAKDDVLILVDAADQEVGTATKAQAHVEGLLHRAFSVVLVREAAGASSPGVELLLTRRAKSKYHSGGLWTNSCCSHPRAGEELLAAAARRVREELGCEAPPLEELGAFTYCAEFANGMTEYEFDHVLLGYLAPDTALSPDVEEIGEVRWITPAALAAALAAHPETFTAWAPDVFALTFSALHV